MVKSLLTLIFAIFISWTAYAQETGSISGVVREPNGPGVAFATLVLLDQDSAMAKAGFTEDDGVFAFEGIAPGQYRLQIRSIQYKTYTSSLFNVEAGKNKAMPVIEIVADVQKLAEVEVTATKPLVEVMPDKMVFNVESSVNASGNDGMELLRKAPGVMVDNNDNILLQGKNGTRIYIDGKPSQLRGEDLVAMLRSMQSDDIEAIEIITSPGARYDADGNAGIINIRLKRDKNLGSNATVNTNYAVGNEDRISSGISFNNRSKKANLFGSYNFYDNTGFNDINIDKIFSDVFLDQSSLIVWNNVGHNFRVGSDLYLNKQHTVGVLVNGNISENNVDNTSRTPIIDNSTNTVLEILDASSDQNDVTDNVSANLNYQWNSPKLGKLNVDLDYGYFWKDLAIVQPNTYLSPDGESVSAQRNFANDQTTQIDLYTAKADYEKQIGQGTFSAGLKYAAVKTENQFEFFSLDGDVRTLDTDRSNDFTYDERVAAFYTSYSGKINDKASFNLGMRIENTNSDGKLTSTQSSENDRVKRSYTDFFPTAGITYQPNKNHSLALNYGRRIDRPNYRNLNPFEFKLDELTFERGNPFLNPQYTNNVQVTHTFKQKLTTQLGYSITNDFFAQLIDTTDTRGTILQQENLAKTTNLNLNVSYPAQITQWWNVFTNLSVYRSLFEVNQERAQTTIDVVTYNLYVQNNFVLPKGIKIELSGWYNSPSVWDGTFETEDMWSVDFGIKKNVLNDRATLRMGVSDLFLSRVWSGRSDVRGVVLKASGRNDTRRFRVGFNYRLGNQQVKSSRKRKTGLDDVQKRIN